MQPISSSLKTIFSRKDSINVFWISTLLIFLVILFFQNGMDAMQVLNFNLFSPSEKATLFLKTLFDVVNPFTASTITVVILSSLLSGLNISLLYTYNKLRSEAIIKSGLYSGIGLIFALLGVGCVACGTALLVTLLSFVGLSSTLQILPYRGEEVAYIGLIVIIIATYNLMKKVSSPYTC